MKRTCILSVIACCILNHAYAMPLLNESYITLESGVLQANVNQRYYDLTDLFQQNIAETVQQNSYIAVIGIGGDFYHCGMYQLGAELSFGYLSHQHARYAAGAATAAFTDSFRIKYFADLVIRPSVKTPDTGEVYVKLGYSLAKLHDRLTTPVGTVPEPVLSSYGANKNRSGFVLGFGYETRIAAHYSVYAEYLYHDYHRVKLPSFTNFTADYSHHAQVTTNMFMLGVNYYPCV